MRRLAQYLYRKVLYFFLGKNKYLRRIGVKLGERVLVITAVENFGSEPWLIKLNDDIVVAHGVKFITHDASTRLFRKKHESMNHVMGNKFLPIVVNSNVFIGVNAIILPGVTIGSNTVVAAGAVVTKSIADGGVYGGVPARFICSIEDYEKRSLENCIEIKATNLSDLKKELAQKFPL